MSQVNLLVIEDSTVREIVRDPRFSHLPCVQSFNSQVSVSKTKCGRCKSKINAALGQATQSFVNCLSRLPPNLRNDLKRLLNARQLRIIRPNAKGQRVQITF